VKHTIILDLAEVIVMNSVRFIALSKVPAWVLPTLSP
jgi:hypothetical protein